MRFRTVADTFSRVQHALEYDPGILPPVHQFLHDMVDVLKEPEQKRILGIAQQLPQFLREPEVKHRIIEVVTGGIIFHDLDPVPCFQGIQEAINSGAVLYRETHHQPVRVCPGIVKIHKGNVTVRRGCVGEELEKRSRTVGEIDRTFEESRRPKRSLEIANVGQFIMNVPIALLSRADLEKYGPGVDPTVVMKAVDISPYRVTISAAR
jgi:hypothetical protein